MKKRAVSMILALCLLFSLSAPAFAAENTAETAAQALYNLGLFKGVGNNTDGTPNFDLNRAPNRAEAVTMLVRLLGKEEEALAGTWENSFTDVPSWAAPYVGYAYANGLTKGVNKEGTLFGGDSLVSATQYLTFVLRALGYQDGVDFQWNAAWEKTDEIGITKGEYSAESNEITRGGVAVISDEALEATYKDGSSTLLEALVEAGAVTQPEQPAATDDAQEMKVTRGNDGLIIEVASQAQLTAALNQTEKVEAIKVVKDFTVTEDSGVDLGPDKFPNYGHVTVTIEKDVTLTVAKGGQLGAYWFTFEGDWDNGPNVKHINNGTVIVEKDGWINGDFGDNYGTILVKDGGQCQTMPNNYGTVTVESGGSYRTTQGQEAINEGTITIAAGANMVSRFGSTIDNRGSLTVDGLLSVGYINLPPEGEGQDGHEEFWFRNSGTVTGTGTARVYDAFNEDGESEYSARMVELMKEALGADTTLTIVAGIGTGV